MALHNHGECLSSKLRFASSKTRQRPHAFTVRRLSVQGAQADLAVGQKRSKLSLTISVVLKAL